MPTRLPDFLVIGAMKCATTSLCAQLASHPEVFFSKPKEPAFFNRDENHARGLAHYARLFGEAGAAQVAGEGSTSYSKVGVFPETPRRIAKALPDARFIYILRDPVRRTESHWLHAFRKRSRSIPPFNEAVAQPDSPYLDASLYWRQLQAYRAYFDDDRFLLLFYEDFRADPQAVLRRCFRFLGVAEDFTAPAPDDWQRNQSVGVPYDRPLVSRLRRSHAMRSLVRRLPPGVQRLARRPFQRVLETRPEWEPEVLERVLEVVAPDARRILAWCGRPADHWPLHGSAYLEARDAAAGWAGERVAAG